MRIHRQEESEARAERVRHLGRRRGRIRQEIARLQAIDHALADALDGQIFLTDTDARATATSARHSGMVGYDVQSTVNTDTHLIVAHEVTNQGFDRDQLSPMQLGPRRRSTAMNCCNRRQVLLQRPRDPRMLQGWYHHDHAAPGHFGQCCQRDVCEDRLH